MVLARGCSDAISRWICLRSPLRSPLTLPFYPSPGFTLLSRILCSGGCRFLLLYSRFLTSISVTPRRNRRKITYLSTMSLKRRHCLKEPSGNHVSINSYAPKFPRRFEGKATHVTRFATLAIYSLLTVAYFQLIKIKMD